MKCQPLALLLILFSISHKAVKGKAAGSQVADSLARADAYPASTSSAASCPLSSLDLERVQIG